MGRRLNQSLAVLFGILALVLAACGDDDAGLATEAPPANDAPATSEAGDDEAREADATSEPQEAEPAAPVDVEADRQIAEQANLRLEDFPPGWQERPREDDFDEAGGERIAECAGYDFDQLYGDEGERVLSPTFVSSRDEEVRSAVTVYGSQEVAQRRYDAVTDPAVIECIVEETRRMLAFEGAREGFQVEDVQINRLSTSTFGDETYGYRVSMELEAQGMSVTAHSDIVGIRIGRVGVRLESFSTFTPYRIEELEEHAATVVSRVDPAEAE